jgi:hypothetical protein
MHIGILHVANFLGMPPFDAMSQGLWKELWPSVWCQWRSSDWESSRRSSSSSTMAGVLARALSRLKSVTTGVWRSRQSLVCVSSDLDISSSPSEPVWSEASSSVTGWSVKATCWLFRFLRTVQNVSCLELGVVGWSVKECDIYGWRIQRYCAFELPVLPFELYSVTECSTPCPLLFRVVVVCLLGPAVLGRQQSKGCGLGVE